MKFANIPSGDYSIGQIVKVLGRKCRVESYSHTGRNVIVVTIDKGPFLRIVCVKSTSAPIEGITA